jgi:hypothetical protein
MGELDEQEIDPEIYDTSAPASSQKSSKLARVRRTIKPRFLKFHRAKDLANQVGVLNEGDSVYAVISGDFIAGDIIEAYLTTHNMRADELICSTLSYSDETVDSFANLRKAGYVGSIGIIVSDYFFSHERAQGIRYTIDTLAPLSTEAEPFTLAAAGTHMKVTLMKTECGRHLVIHGSANLRSSRCVEQIVIECNKELYEFNRAILATVLNKFRAKHPKLRRADWLADTIAEHKEHGKSLRSNSLWKSLL